MAKKDFFPSVLAYEKKIVTSDAFFHSMKSEDFDVDNIQESMSKSKAVPILVKSVRGTMSQYGSDKPADSNLQTVDAAYLDENHDMLAVEFSGKILSGLDKPSACNKAEFADAYAKALSGYQDELKELSSLYAYNIANARFLWRNRLGAKSIVTAVEINDETIIFDSFNYALNGDSVDEKVDKLGKAFYDAFSGKADFLLFSVKCFATIGKAMEVYPSEELIPDKDVKKKGAKSKTLYSVNGVAAMHSQKLGNAIRTVDRWYPDFAGYGMPIAAEPFGAVTNINKAFRTADTKKDFYSLLSDFVFGKLEGDDVKYMLSVFIRGGVFGVSGKEKGAGSNNDGN